MLGTTYRKEKIVGSYGVGRNYILMKLEEVGRVPEDQIAIQRMVVLTCPSSHFYQLSFRQCLLRFFLNQFLGTFRDFTNDDDELLQEEHQNHQSSDSSSSNSMRWSFRQRRCVRMGVMSVPWIRNQSHVSHLFILDFIIIISVLFKLCFLSTICFFHSMLSFSYPCFLCYFLDVSL